MILLDLLLPDIIPVLAQETSTASASSVTPLIGCGFFFIPLYIGSIWYWSRYYYVRYGLISAIIAGLLAMVIYPIAMTATIWDIFYRSVTGKQQIIESCPHCGSKKLVAEGFGKIPHAIQPQCPHCKQDITIETHQQGNSPSQEIINLLVLKQKGEITEEEYQMLKAKVVKR